MTLTGCETLCAEVDKLSNVLLKPKGVEFFTPDIYFLPTRVFSGWANVPKKMCQKNVPKLFLFFGTFLINVLKLAPTT